MQYCLSFRWLLAILFLSLLTACRPITLAPAPLVMDPGASPLHLSPSLGESTLEPACKVTEPEWAKPPEDSAVLSTPAFSYYFINADSSIWASAWFADEAGQHSLVNGEDIKVGWFRPAGIPIEITGRRLDGEAAPLEVDVPCCYPTRFQATSLMFPTQGCWEVTARAADSELSFVVMVKP